MSLNLSLSMELRQGLSLRHIIEFSNLLAVPDEVLNIVGGAISHNPSMVERVLQSRRGERPSTDDSSSAKTQTIYSSLIQSKGGTENRRRGGLIISPDPGTLESFLPSYRVSVTPDVTYIGRRNERPEIVFSDHIKGSMSLVMLQLDPLQYPETSRLLTQLRRFDEWKRSTLRKVYVTLGGAQREFLEDFDITRFNIFPLEKLADESDLSLSTVSRVLANRLVEARNVAGEQMFLYAKDVCITEDRLRRYLALPELNAALVEEFERGGGAYSDMKLAKKASNEGLARRTIAKYRASSDIPHWRERNRIYNAGGRGEPYQFTVYKPIG